MIYFRKPYEVTRMIDVRDNILHVDGNPIANEDELFTILEKAQKWDELNESKLFLDEEKFIADGEDHYAKTWNIADGDDF